MKEIAEWKREGGILLIDKPYEWTSFDVVKKLRNVLKYKKIGHAGTLDPLATGLLVVCFGKFTKQIEIIQSQFKVYVAELQLGSTTPSYDLETEIDAEFPTSHISRELIDSKLEDFRGEIKQFPPVFSAVKIDGKRAYELARQGKEVKMKERTVQIYELEVLSFKNDKLSLKIKCSKGTYIRTLAHDIGRALDSGAHLLQLRRTQIGTFDVDNASLPTDLKTEEDLYLQRISKIESTPPHK